MSVKTCIKCGKTKRINHFYDAGYGDGRTKNTCKDCCKQRNYDGMSMMDDYISHYNGCVVCGYNKYYGAIDLHHVYPETKVKALSDMVSYSKQNIEKELRKTVPLCKCCHVEYHKGLGVDKKFLEEKLANHASTWNLNVDETQPQLS